MHATYMLQKRIFDEISQKVEKENLAKTISVHLHIDKSAVYKRIRLERRLSIDELLILTREFDLSIDHLIQRCQEPSISS